MQLETIEERHFRILSYSPISRPDYETAICLEKEWYCKLKYNESNMIPNLNEIMDMQVVDVTEKGIKYIEHLQKTLLKCKDI